ncbi:major capsid protein [Natroniella sp. ANB-PHB2]|uniref:major capsid protein n=1 Tax=Natroniella sp. ANB-PHB2 TaxID=3384444 RepID=UPI0038D39545
MTKVAQVSSPKSLGMANNKILTLINSGLRLNSLRTNSILKKDEWKQIDSRVVTISYKNLVAVNDLIENGLDRDNGGLGTTMDGYPRRGEKEEAQIDMSGTSGGQEEHTDYDEVGVPIPVLHSNFRINIRRLLAARQNGRNLDTTEADESTRVVNTAMEKMIFKGADVSVDGAKIYGYCNVPGRFTGSLSDWTTGADVIYKDIKEMIFKLINKGFIGPFYLYLGANRYDKLFNYVDGSDQTALDRITNLPGLEEIKNSPGTPKDDVVLVQMTSNVVDLSIGEDVQTVEWESYGGMEMQYKVMAAMAPRVKRNKNEVTGIVHYS